MNEETRTRLRLLTLEKIVAKLLEKQGVPDALIEEWLLNTAEVKFDETQHLNAGQAIVKHLDEN